MESKRGWVDEQFEEHVRQDIEALPDTYRENMASLILQGVHFRCTPQSGPGMFRWWNVYGPSGKHWAGTGGAALSTVVRRAYEKPKEQW